MNTPPQRGRRAAETFTQSGVWVLVAAISPTAKTLYALLRAHVNNGRGDGLAYPSQDALAQMLGRSQSVVSRAVAELVAIGAIEVLARRRHGAHVYLVHDGAPAGHAGARNLSEFYTPQPERQRRPRAGRPAGRGDTGGPGRAADMRPRMSGDASAHVATSADASEVEGVELDEGRNPLPPARRPRRRRRMVDAPAGSRPPWCGHCDGRTRQRLTEQELPFRCPDCHPLAAGSVPGPGQEPGGIRDRWCAAGVLGQGGALQQGQQVGQGAVEADAARFAYRGELPAAQLLAFGVGV